VGLASQETVEKIKGPLEAAGIQFLEGGSTAGASGVALRPRPRDNHSWPSIAPKIIRRKTVPDEVEALGDSIPLANSIRYTFSASLLREEIN
jgi:hypothetical protein